MQQDSNTVQSTHLQLDTKRCMFSSRRSQGGQPRSKSVQPTALQDLPRQPQMFTIPIEKFMQPKLKNQQIARNIQIQNQADKYRTIHWNVQIVRKVVDFLQSLKRSVVQSKKSLDPLQLFYLQNQSGQGKAQQQNVIAWDNLFLLTFQGFFSIGLLIGVWLCNYQAIFQKTQIGIIFYSVILSSYFLSFVITLNTEIKTIKLQVISKRSQIMYNYIKNQAIYQGIAFLSLLLIIANVPYLYYPARILFMTSVKTIQRISMKIQDKYAASNSMENWISIIKFIFNIITFLHFLSIIFNALHLIQKQAGTTFTWVENNNLQGQSNFALYIGGYYWAATIISTVGFGDFTPGNNFQRGIISFVMIFCCLFFGYCLNVIGKLIGALGQSTALYQKDIRKLNRYLKTIKIPKELQDKIKQHFYNRYQIQQVYDQHTETYLLNKLTDQLRNSISQTSNIQILGKSAPMSFLTKKTKKLLTNVMKKQVYAPGQVIFDQHTKQVKLLLVAQGNIGEYCFDRINSTSLKGKKPIAKYNSADNTIGWVNFVTGNKYKSSAKAENYSLVYQISQEDFFKIIRKNRNDLMKFTQVRQKYLQKKIKFKKECLVCNKFRHNVIDCPKIHFTPKPAQLMLSEIKAQLNKINNKRNPKVNRIDKRQFEGLILEQASNSFKLLRVGQEQNQTIPATIHQITESSSSNSQNQTQNQKKVANFREDSDGGQQKRSLVFQREILKNKITQKLRGRRISIFGKQQPPRMMLNSVQKKAKPVQRSSIRECRQYLVDNSLLAQKFINTEKKSLFSKRSSYHDSQSIQLHRNSKIDQLQKSSLASKINKSSKLIEQSNKSTEKSIVIPNKYQESEFNIDAVMLQGNSNFFPEYNISKMMKQENSKVDKKIERIKIKVQMNASFAHIIRRTLNTSH